MTVGREVAAVRKEIALAVSMLHSAATEERIGTYPSLLWLNFKEGCVFLCKSRF